MVVTQQCSSEIRLNVSPGEHEKTSLFPHLQHLTESTKLRKDKINLSPNHETNNQRPNPKVGEMMLNSQQTQGW